MRRIPLFLALLAMLLGATSDAEHIQIGGRDVAIWKPSGPAPAEGYPIILFSHGFGGCNTQTTFLMDAFAQAGYLVVAPNHQDARCGSARHANRGAGFRSARGNRPEEPFQKPAEWSDATYRDREADIKAILDEIAAAKSFHGVPVDANRIGISGHSLGGYTALGVAGAWPSWKDPRIKAVLALSPFSTPYVQQGDLGHMNVPVMYQGGTLDLGVTPTVRKSQGAYNRSSAPKYYIEFGGAGHFAWTDLNHRYCDVIDAYSLAFFDEYLRGKSEPLKALMGSGRRKEVSYLRAQP